LLSLLSDLGGLDSDTYYAGCYCIRSFVADFFDEEICFCFSFLLSTIIPFITKSSNTNTIFERSNYYLDTLIDSAGDNYDYDASIVMIL